MIKLACRIDDPVSGHCIFKRDLGKILIVMGNGNIFAEAA